ncbi:MAG: hypothetical protein IKV99_06495 [Oscillospiraceae bacterium]|nr:hypothetical protein [Oscillospiraceae bacterium]
MVFTHQFYVGYSSVGKDLAITNSGLLRMFEDIATMHGTAVNDGLWDTTDRWVLLAYQVCVHRRPKLGQELTLRSWNRDMKGVTSCREFELYDEAGELMVTAISNWVRIDGNTGKLQRLTRELFDQYGSEPQRGNFPSPWIAKLRESEEGQCTYRCTVERYFIDTNEHLNNVHYMDLALCALPQEVYDRGECDRFTIYYRKAVLCGEEVQCLYREDAGGCTVSVRGAEGESRALIRFEK